MFYNLTGYTLPSDTRQLPSTKGARDHQLVQASACVCCPILVIPLIMVPTDLTIFTLFDLSLTRSLLACKACCSVRPLRGWRGVWEGRSKGGSEGGREGGEGGREGGKGGGREGGGGRWREGGDGGRGGRGEMEGGEGGRER